MTTTQTEFDVLQSEMESRGAAGVIERVADQLREKKRYGELFEALKMQTRQQIGLPLLDSDVEDDLDDETHKQLEKGLLDACREVGSALLRDGNIREGWMYLRPVGERNAVAQVLADVEANEDNIDEMVEVCLHEGVDPERGFRLVLDNYGTCNAITTFESAMHQRQPEEQQAAAAMLVDHLHHELLLSVKADIQQNEGQEPPENSLKELVTDREWLFGEHRYHLDTTHLASTTRFARLLSDEPHLRLALDMTEYGRRLHDQFQYQGDEPFAEIYPSHALYFKALLGEDVEDALAFFREKATSVDQDEFGRNAVEVYIDLLARLGRYPEAIAASINLTPPGTQPMGHAPSLLELSQQAGQFDQLLRFCRDRDDLLGFAAALVQTQPDGEGA